MMEGEHLPAPPSSWKGPQDPEALLQALVACLDGVAGVLARLEQETGIAEDLLRSLREERSRADLTLWQLTGRGATGPVALPDVGRVPDVRSAVDSILSDLRANIETPADARAPEPQPSPIDLGGDTGDDATVTAVIGPVSTFRMAGQIERALLAQPSVASASTRRLMGGRLLLHLGADAGSAQGAILTALAEYRPQIKASGRRLEVTLQEGAAGTSSP